MTSSPDLIHELRASRPSAPLALRARVREIAAEQPARAARAGWRFPIRRGVLVAVPAAAALAFASAGVLGLARSDAPVSGSVAERDRVQSLEARADKSTPASGSALVRATAGRDRSSLGRSRAAASARR